MKLSNDKLILVIGGTGAQGQAVVKELVEPSSDGAPSPYTVRILTRNPDHPKVKAEFNHPNVELVQGSFTDLAKVERALKGVWGAYINTDGFTVGEQAETYYGLRIFELAACVTDLDVFQRKNRNRVPVSVWRQIVRTDSPQIQSKMTDHIGASLSKRPYPSTSESGSRLR